METPKNCLPNTSIDDGLLLVSYELILKKMQNRGQTEQDKEAKKSGNIASFSLHITFNI